MEEKKGLGGEGEEGRISLQLLSSKEPIINATTKNVLFLFNWCED